MKKIIFAIIAIILIAVGAYLILNRSGSSGEATGNEPLEYVRHTSKDFSFEYPRHWFVEDKPENFLPYVALRNYESGASGPVGIPENYFKIEIVKFTKDPELRLESWIDEYMRNSESQPEILSQNFIEVGNSYAVSQLEKVQGIIHPVVYIDRGDSVYTIGATPLFKQFEDIYDNVLESFAFE